MQWSIHRNALRRAKPGPVRLAASAFVDSPRDPTYIANMGDPLKKEDRRFTYHDYCGWPEGERWELIDGVAYDMSPAPSRHHQGLSRELVLRIGGFLAGKPCTVYSAPFDVRIPSFPNQDDDDIDTVVQPDIVVVCDRSKLDDKGSRGAPDMVVETLSPSTAAKDLKVKLALFERCGVREVWFLHPAERIVTMYLLSDQARYGRPAYFGAKDTLESSVLAGMKIDLETFFRDAEN